MIDSYLRERKSGQINFFDELANSEGKIFPHWEKLAAYYNRIGDRKLLEKAAEVDRYLKENGVTYNIYGDPAGLNRPWHLDPVPILIDEKDWEEVERGVKQRADLLNLLLKDIYGSRTLIRQGLLPFDLIFLTSLKRQYYDPLREVQVAKSFSKSEFRNLAGRAGRRACGRRCS